VAATGGDDVVAVEVENRTAVPVALAFAVRPYTPAALSAITSIGLDGRVVTVDGVAALVLPEPPPDVRASEFELEPKSSGTRKIRVPVADGLVTSVFVLPLAHRAGVRVAMPAKDAGDVDPAALPSSEQVARGWDIQAAHGTRIVVPDERVMAAF